MCFGTSNSYVKGRTERAGRLQTAWWCAWPRRNGRGGAHAKPKHWTRLCQGTGFPPGVRVRAEPVPRAPRGGVGMADLRVGSTHLVRGSPREDVLVSCRTRGCRTAIARAVRGTPNRKCGIAAAALSARCGHQSRKPGGANPPGPWRVAHRDHARECETPIGWCQRSLNDGRACVRLSSRPAGR